MRVSSRRRCQRYTEESTMSKQLSGQRPPAKQTQRRERREEMQRRDQAQLAAKRRRNIMIIGIVICASIVGAVASSMAFMSALSPSPTANTNQLAPPVGNIQCDAA